MALENGKILNLMKFKIQKIAGDASFRNFYRIISNRKSQIIVFTKKEKYKNLVVYTSINKLLIGCYLLLLIMRYLQTNILGDKFPTADPDPNPRPPHPRVGPRIKLGDLGWAPRRRPCARPAGLNLASREFRLSAGLPAGGPSYGKPACAKHQDWCPRPRCPRPRGGRLP